MKFISRILLAASLIATLASCGNNNQFAINGTIGSHDLDGQTIYLLNGNSLKDIVDSTTITNGQFAFSGTVDTPWVALIANNSFNQQCIIEAGTINVASGNIGGTPMNAQLQSFADDSILLAYESELNTYLQLYYAAPDAKSRAQAEHSYDSIEAIAVAHTLEQAWQLYRTNPDNILGAYAMDIISQNGNFTHHQLDSILATASPIVANYQPVKDKLEQLRCIEATSVGKHYTDIEGVDGRLSDLIDGHLALVDFYASWCGPCRAEIRDNLVPLWKKYQNKGLVIVGLNVWERGNREQREAAHQKVMADLGITYPQLVDSTRNATTIYGVRGIPQIMLISPDGTILARDLRGAAIEEAIVKAL